jgi:hypothetical protein
MPVKTAQEIRIRADKQGDKRQFYFALAAMTASDSAGGVS